MSPFRNILVGVDLTQYDPKTLQPSAVAREVVRQALWLAGKTSGRLTFFAALNLTSERLPYLEAADLHRLASTAEQNANTILAGLAGQARERGIEAAAKFSLGGAWLEVVREVLRNKHDLLLVGTRDRTGLGRMLFGSTAIKLVRRCPCPVWVAKPEQEPRHLNILVASDLSPVSDKCLSLALQLAEFTPATVHVLHIVDYPLDHIWSTTGLPSAKELMYRQEVRRRAEQSLRTQLQNAGASAADVRVHLMDDAGGLPDEGILAFIHKHPIDLVVMGTIGRGGISGAMIGNTAERLLPGLTCSLLAVKPAEFVCPVKV